MKMTGAIRTAIKRITGNQSFNSDDDQRSLIPHPQTIFDVGANVGQSVRTYRRLYPKAHIWSFEPCRTAYDQLVKSAKPDGFHPVHKALSDKVGTDTLNLGGISLTNSLLRRDGDSGFSEQIATDTLDRFCEENEISEIDILKVDVEGAEMRVFRGAQEMFERAAVRAVFVEVYFVETYEGMPLVWDLHEFLMGQGFHLRNLYSPFIGQSKCLSFANALYLQPDLIK